MKSSIANEFERYIKAVFKVKVPPHELQELNRAFHAGALTVMAEIGKAMHGDPDAAVQRIQEIMAELDEYCPTTGGRIGSVIDPRTGGNQYGN